MENESSLMILDQLTLPLVSIKPKIVRSLIHKFFLCSCFSDKLLFFFSLPGPWLFSCQPPFVIEASHVISSTVRSLVLWRHNLSFRLGEHVWVCSTLGINLLKKKPPATKLQDEVLLLLCKNISPCSFFSLLNHSLFSDKCWMMQEIKMTKRQYNYSFLKICYVLKCIYYQHFSFPNLSGNHFHLLVSGYILNT